MKQARWRQRAILKTVRIGLPRFARAFDLMRRARQRWRATPNGARPPASLQRRNPGSRGRSRPANERRATAGLLAHGSLRFRRLPVPRVARSGIWRGARRLQLRAQPRIGGIAPHRVPSSRPYRTNRRRAMCKAGLRPYQTASGLTWLKRPLKTATLSRFGRAGALPSLYGTPERQDQIMAKEKFERTKPHCNIGTQIKSPPPNPSGVCSSDGYGRGR